MIRTCEFCGNSNPPSGRFVRLIGDVHFFYEPAIIGTDCCDAHTHIIQQHKCPGCWDLETGRCSGIGDDGNPCPTCKGHCDWREGKLNLRVEELMEEKATIRLFLSSWRNIIDTVRSSQTSLDTKGNFWAAIQHLESQLDDEITT